jgi:hypothetical protein
MGPGFFHGLKRTGPKFGTYLRIVPRLRLSGVMPPHPLYNFVARRGVTLNFSFIEMGVYVTLFVNMLSLYVNMNRVKEDEMNGAAYEDKATVECRILTDVDRFCGANRSKLLAPKVRAVMLHVTGAVIFM